MKLDFRTLHRGKDNKFYCNDSDTGRSVVIEEAFPINEWDSPNAFKSVGIRGYDPMKAKELETEEVQDKALNDSDNIIEEKFDGTRALVYFLSQECIESGEVADIIGFCRVFSRQVSKKTGFYAENSNSLPQIREIDVPELSGTILDGELFINGLPFKEVSSTLNCLWDKALDRQIDKGFISLHAFDILFYKGVDMRNLPLERRKYYLHLAVEEADSPYIEEVKYFNCGKDIDTRVCVKEHGEPERVYKYLKDTDKLGSYPSLEKLQNNEDKYLLSPRQFYEYIVATGGEGVIVKSKKGKYHHKRCWEYSKIKKFLTRELIVIGFSEPTKEYTGKSIKKWGFWVEKDTDKRVLGNFYGDSRYIPVTKNYYYKQVGNLILGVLITEEEYNSIPKNKRGQLYQPVCVNIYDKDELYVMEVCECSGFDDEMREHFTTYKDNTIGTVIEVKANELYKDSGKMRHPRYLRQRFDKNAEDCTWSEHIMSE